MSCGGVEVRPGDWVIADEEGIAVVPAGQLEETWAAAVKRAEKDAAQNLEEWEQGHRASVETILASKELA